MTGILGYAVKKVKRFNLKEVSIKYIITIYNH